MAACLFTATSCSQDEELVSGGDTGKEQVSFQIEMDATGPTSRALGDGTGADKLYYEVWDMNTKQTVYDAVVNVIDLPGDKKGAELKFDLVKGVPYDILFWAHNEKEGSAFDASDLTAVTMKTASLKANKEAYDAFYGRLNNFKVQSAGKNVVTLKRPFAQVNVGTTKADWEKAEGLKVEIDQSLMTVKNVNTVFNVATATASAPLNITYALNDLVDKSNTFTVTKAGVETEYYYLGMNYMLADEDKSLNDMEIELHDGEYLINTLKVASMPIQRNYRTNVIGNLLTSEEGFEVVIDANFTDSHVVELWNGEIKQPATNPQDANEYWIYSAAELAWVAASVNGESRSAVEDFAGKTILLKNDIDLNNFGWMPIGAKGNTYENSFKGILDGAGFTIHNLVVENKECAGLIGRIHGAVVKNLTVKNVNLQTNHYAGGIVAWAESSSITNVIENCRVENGKITVTPELKNGVYVDGDKAGAIVGYSHNGTINNCEVDGVEVEAFRDLGGIVGCATGTITNNTVKNTSIIVNQTYAPYEKEQFDTNAGNIVGRINGDITKKNNTAENVNKVVGIGSLDPSLAVEPTNTNDNGDKVIENGNELIWFVNYVNGTLPVEAKSVSRAAAQDNFVLGCDIDLNGLEWTPIGTSEKPYKGIFDGNGHTISNLKITGYNSNVGFFGDTRNGEIKNLTINNAKVSGRLNVGVVAGNPYTSKYSDIKVTGHVEVNGMAYVGGVGGKNAYADWNNITVEVDETSYVNANSVENGTAYRTYVGGVIGFMGEGGHKVSNVTSNIYVKGSTIDVGGIVGIAHYGNTFENVICNADVEIYNASEQAEADQIGGIAGVWHNGGENVTFTSCKFNGELRVNGGYVVNTQKFGNLVCAAYHADGAGKLVIDGVEYMQTAAGVTIGGVTVVDNSESLIAALKEGKSVKLIDDIEIPENTTIIIANGIESTLDLNGQTLSSTNKNTGNAEFFLVKGKLNVNNGTIEYKYTGANQGWNAMSAIFDITAGGVLNMNGVVANNLGGTDMAFAVHMNNWGDATLNASNCEFLATYCGVRVFNSGPQMNNVTIENSKLTGKSMAFWVHNYIYENCGDATLNLNIYNKNNTFEITGTAVSPIRYGFGAYYYYNEAGKLVAVDVDDENGLNSALNAIDAKKVGTDVTILLSKDITGNATIVQKEGVNLIVDGQGHKYNGTIYIHGQARYNNEETLTIQNVNFWSENEMDFISSNETGSAERYAHNVTVKDCTFTGSDNDDVVGMRYRQSFNMSVVNCTATKMHSLMQATGGDGITVDGVEVKDCKNGIAFGTSKNVVVKNSAISAKGDYGYGIRVDASDAYNMNVENSTVAAAAPLLLRKATALNAYSLKLSGKNNLVTSKDYQLIVTASDYDEGTELTKATGKINLVGTEGLSIFGLE